MMWRGQLKQRRQFTSLLLWHRCRSYGGLYLVLVQIDKYEVVFWKFNLFIPAFNSDDVRAGGFKRLDKSCGKDRNEDTTPSQRVQQLDEGLACKVKHGSMRRQEDNAGFRQSELNSGSAECLPRL